MVNKLSSAGSATRRFLVLARQWGIAVFLASAFVVGFAAPSARAADNSRIAERTLQGKLLYVKGTGPVVKTAEKEVPLAGRNKYVFATLGDKRLRGDEVRLKGWMRGDGNFEVDVMHTIHHGELYRIRYYCETCHIVGLGPGRCVCCQQPTELQEIPLNKNDKNIRITH